MNREERSKRSFALRDSGERSREYDESHYVWKNKFGRKSMVFETENPEVEIRFNSVDGTIDTEIVISALKEVIEQLQNQD